jgi:hypothetical protein
MADYKFDRTAFRVMTFEEADAANVYNKNVSYSERLRQAYYLISQAYGFTMDNQPKIDKACLSSRKLHN